MHYFEDNEWKETRAEFDQIGGVFIAQLGADPVVDLLTPDGTRVRSRPAMLVVHNRATDERYRISLSKNSQGILVAPNQVLYPDAFESFHADLRAVYTIFGFEWDVILREDPPDVADLLFGDLATPLFDLKKLSSELPKKVKFRPEGAAPPSSQGAFILQRSEAEEFGIGASAAKAPRSLDAATGVDAEARLAKSCEVVAQLIPPLRYPGPVGVWGIDLQIAAVVSADGVGVGRVGFQGADRRTFSERLITLVSNPTPFPEVESRSLASSRVGIVAFGS